MNVLPHLIVGNSHDYHATAVAWALGKLGENVIVWDGIGGAREDSVTIKPKSEGVRLGDVEVNRLKSIWFRRQIPFKEVVGVNEDSLAFTKRELFDAHHSLSVTSRGIADFVVGKNYTRDANAKAHQMRVAHHVGFNVPDTVITNSFEEARSFVNGRQVIVKHFAPHYFLSRGNGSIRGVGPVVIRELLEEDRASVQVAPCIYQELVEKTYDLRVTVIGRRQFCAKIIISDTVDAVDWRPLYGTKKVCVEDFTLDRRTSMLIEKLMEELGLEYGCIDLAADAQGILQFLEVNPGGQFLFIQDEVESQNLLLAFASMLQQGSKSYVVDDCLNESINIAGFEASADYLKFRESYDVPRRNDRFLTYVD